MNTSFDAWKIVNTYGAFGSITKERTEVVLQGTLAPPPGSSAQVRHDLCASTGRRGVCPATRAADLGERWRRHR